MLEYLLESQLKDTAYVFLSKNCMNKGSKVALKLMQIIF